MQLTASHWRNFRSSVDYWSSVLFIKFWWYITAATDYCRRAKVPVIFTQHGYRDLPKESGMLGQWWDDPIVVGTEKWKRISEIAPNREEKIIRKRRYSTFYGTDLDGILKILGVKDVIIVGVMTNLCCETTARDAFVRDYRVFFLVDGTATVSEDYHLTTLKNLVYGVAYLKQCDDIITELSPFSQGRCFL